jgi:hypothetical protein
MVRNFYLVSITIVLGVAIACGGGGGSNNGTGTSGGSAPKQPSFTISNLSISPSLFIQNEQTLAYVYVDVSPSVGTIKQMNLIGGNGSIIPSLGIIHGPNTNTIVGQLRVDNSSIGVFTNGIQLETATGNISNVLSQKITIVAFLPNLNQIAPSSATTGSNGFILKATGTGFSPNSVVMWNSNFSPPAYQLKTTYISSTELHAEVPQNALTKAEVVGVFVSTPDVWSTASQSFVIQNP